MLHSRELWVVRGGGGPPCVGDDVERVLLDGAAGRAVRRMTLREFLADEREARGASAVWIFAPDETQASDPVFEAVGRLESARVPGLLSCDGMGDAAGAGVAAGVIAAPLDAPHAVRVALLRSTLNHARVLQAMKAEARLLNSQQAGVAEQMDRLDEELRMAVKIQREFLPRVLPSPEQAAFDVLWRPAGYVGGDIYDVSRLDEHHYGLFLADAVGHGVPAALMTIHIRQSMQTREATPGQGEGYRLLPPGEALATLNRSMIELDAGPASLGTAVYGVLDVRTQRLTLAKAGHPAPLLLRADGQTDWLEPEGAMLGILPDEVFDETTVQLRRGDRLLLYSDGFEVAFPQPDGGRLANTRFTEAFESLRHGGGADALDRLSDMLDASSGSLSQRDDLTVVCMTALMDAAEGHGWAAGERSAAA